MKKLMLTLGGLLVGASVFADIPEPEVKFSFDDDLDAGLHVNEGTAGAVANLVDSYSTYGRGRGALYDVSSGRVGVYGYSPWCRELVLGDSFTVAMSFKASAAPNEILLCLGDLDGTDRVLMVATDGESAVKVVVGNRDVFEEVRIPVSGGSDRSHLLCLGYSNEVFAASVDGGSSVTVGGDRPAGGFQILGGRSGSQKLPAPFVHGCGVVDPQSGVVSHPNAANVVEDLRIWTTGMLSDEQVGELVATWFATDARSPEQDADRYKVGNLAIWRTPIEVGLVVDFVGLGWRVTSLDSVSCCLITTNAIDRIPFSVDRDDPDYAKSDIRKRINEFERQIRGYSGPQLSWEDVDGYGRGYIRKHNLSDVIKEPYDDILYLMSANEAEAMGTSKLARNILSFSDIWYLRTPGKYNNGNAYVVVRAGYISDFGTKAHIRQYVRPSLEVSLESTLVKRLFFRTNGDDSEKVRKSDAEIGKGFAFGDGPENAGSGEPYRTTCRVPEIAEPEVLRVSQPQGGIIEVPADLHEKNILLLEDTMFVTPYPPTVTYRSAAIAEGVADHLAVIATAARNSQSMIVDYAKVSAAAEGTDVVIPFGKLPQGRYYLSFFAECCEEGPTDECSQEVGGFVIANVSGYFKEGDWPSSVSNKPFTVRAEGVGIRFPEDIGFVQDFEAGKKTATFGGLGTRGGRIDGKVTVDAATLVVSNMTLSALAVTNGGVLNVTGKLTIASPGETLVDGSIAFSAGSVLDVKGGRCVVKGVSGTGVVSNSVPDRATESAFVIADRLTVDVTRTDTLSAKVPLTLGAGFEVFVTNAASGVHGEWTILTASQIAARPDEIKVVADDGSTDLWKVTVVTLPNGLGEALVLANSEQYVRVTVGQADHQSAVWTCGDGAVTNRVENGFFDVRQGETNTKVIFRPDYGYRFAPGESGVRALASPIIEKCTVTPPDVMRSPCAVEFAVDESIAQAAYVVEGVTNELSSGSNRVDIPFGAVVELIAREKPRYYPYAGPYAIRITSLEMSVEIAAKPIPKGLEGNPFEIGERLFATTNTEGVLAITGTGAMDDFPSASDVPWVAPTVTALAIDEGVTKIGANAWMGMPGEVIVDGVLPLSRYAFVGSGFSSSESPVGAIAPVGAERIEIVDGKVQLGVSVATNADLTAVTETWRRADIEDVRKESDGSVTLTVPATAEKGFMILKTKGADPSNRSERPVTVDVQHD